MSTQGDNAYLNTRISVLADQLLSSAELSQLPTLSLDELSRRYSLAPLEEEGLPVSIRLRAVEGALIFTLLSELTLLVRPMYGGARELVIHWARKFELYNLKALVRGKLNGLEEQEIEANLLDLPEFLTLPHHALLRTESVLEMLRQLEQGPYRAIASQARQVFEEHHEAFALESTIDQRYQAGLVKRVRQLAGADLKETQQVIGLQLDRINLLWLLRYRFAYGMAPSETYYQLVPSILQLHRERLLKLVNLPSIERVIEALPEPLSHLLAQAGDSEEVEARMEAFTWEKTRAIVAHNPSPIARALAYLILREFDLKMLFMVVQSRMLGLDDAVLRQAMHLPVTDAGPGRSMADGGMHAP